MVTHSQLSNHNYYGRPVNLWMSPCVEVVCRVIFGILQKHAGSNNFDHRFFVLSDRNENHTVFLVFLNAFLKIVEPVTSNITYTSMQQGIFFTAGGQ